MDISLWLGVAALALAVPLGVASNLLTTKVIAYLEKRTLLKSHRTKRQALVVFNRIKAFKEGKRDRYSFYMILASSRAQFLCSPDHTDRIVLIEIVAQHGVAHPEEWPGTGFSLVSRALAKKFPCK